ncbi:uncharacterized protein SCODWIG_02290 [Saccharomycodes ludwigii]|uniref:Protein RTA1 n=1 Tax=Saccharomycodes ludwigii TaxID=36035 RepID=A0A376B7H9_9ASCO|nr:hypothetical protein SCDLUD_005023 [Saccharomycodes ludwigii]KAH3898700.1 hypothetical protein SCDLUD_005023 [Saccharomycodes ludwigii]SSD60529.1 uncharacterized protein SCODWIG_02290 [Saccharomycodes ludwigii]
MSSNTTDTSSNKNAMYSSALNYSIGPAILFVILFAISFVLLLAILISKYKSLKNMTRNNQEVCNDEAPYCKTTTNGYSDVLNKSISTPLFKKAAKFILLQWPIILGCGLEFGSFVSRIVWIKNEDNIPAFIVQIIFGLVGPGMFASSIHLSFTRMVEILDCYEVVLKGLPSFCARWINRDDGIRIFILSQQISNILLAVGGGISSNQDNVVQGKDLIITGLFLLLAIFSLFLYTLLHFKLNYEPIVQSTTNSFIREIINYSIIGMGTSAILIMIRSIIRIVEFFMGANGYILRHQWFLYVFDSTLMFLIVVIFIITLFFKYNVINLLLEYKSFNKENDITNEVRDDTATYSDESESKMQG